MPVDLPAPNTMGCGALVTCINGCRDQQCQQDCFDQADPDAQQLFQDAVDCVYSWCLEPDGTRPPRCIQDNQGNVVDLPDAGVGRCDRCVGNAYSGLGGYQCQPRNDPDCNPAACQDMINACLSQ